MGTFTETGDKAVLERNLIKLARSKKPRSPASPITIPKRKPQPEEEENSSPLGTFLRDRKKRQRGDVELQLNLCAPNPDATTVAEEEVPA